MIDEIHPIEKYPIYVAFPYLKWVTSKCCYGIPYFKPFVDDDGANVGEEDAQLLASSNSAAGGSATYVVNGKEYKKRSKKHKKKHSEKAAAEEPLA